MEKKHLRVGTDNKVVLLVSYDYPPMGSPGALRTAKFAKYLGRFEWTAIVLANRGGTRSSGLEDHQDLESVAVVRALDWKGLVKKSRTSSDSVPGAAEVGSTKAGPSLLSRVARNILFPDRDITWYPSAVREARRIVRNQQVDAIFSTSPSMTNHLVAGNIARRFRLPWIADFRDLWALAWDSNLSETCHQRLRRRLEKRIVTQADRVVVVTAGLQEAFSEAYPESQSKVSLIRNGFDSEDVACIETAFPTKQLVLTHSGSLYGGDRNTESLLMAIAGLKTKGLLTADRFKLEFIGVPEPQILTQITRLGITDLVACVGKIPYQQALRRMAASSALLIIVHSSHIGYSSVPTKFYDALAVRRPVLALVPKGYELARLVSELGVGEAVHPGNTQEIAEWITKEMHRNEHEGRRPCLDAHVVREYSREQRTFDLASLLNQISN